MNVTATTARTYYPAAQDADALNARSYRAGSLKVQGEAVSAEVDHRGHWILFVGIMSVAEGDLDGTEGPLNTYFAAEALIWSAGIDDDRNAQADADLAAFEAEVTARELTTLTADEIIEMVDTEDIEFKVLNEMHYRVVADPRRMLASLRQAHKVGVNIEIKQGTQGHYIELNDGKGKSSYGQYHFSA